MPGDLFLVSTNLMKRLLIIQHEKDSPPGTTLDWAKLRDYHVDFWYPTEGDHPPADNDFELVVICGGSMDTFEEEKYPWLITEKSFVSKLIQSNMKIFGLCLGSQLLAEALGSSVYKHHGWEIGFVPVKNADGSELNVFHYHQYTFELPVGAELIVQGDYCRNQAFKFKDNIIATQFHPESTPEWIAECADCVSESHKGLVQTKAQILNDILLQKDLQKWYFSQLDKLVKS